MLSVNERLTTLNSMSPICRLGANPEGWKRAASCRPPSVLAPGTALGSCRHGALPSAQAMSYGRTQREGGQAGGITGRDELAEEIYSQGSNWMEHAC
jgi:hypothetical protein